MFLGRVTVHLGCSDVRAVSSHQTARTNLIQVSIAFAQTGRARNVHAAPRANA
jgi:hypothetical protein